MTRPGTVRPLIATTLPMIVMSMNNMVMNNALPSIGASFSTDLTATQWVVTSYILIYATLILVMARIADRLGRRLLFLAGIVIFTVASACGALAPTFPLLIAARCAQATGAAAVLTLSLVLLTSAVPEGRRNITVGLWSGLNGLSIALGPLVGGAVTGGLGWRWVFWINIPVGIASVLLGRSVLRKTPRTQSSLDLPGMIGIITLVMLILAVVSRPGSQEWPLSLTLGVIFGIIVLVPALIGWERTTSSPLVPPHLFRNPALVITNAVSVMLFFAVLGSTLLFSQYLQHAQGYSPLHAGLCSLPATATTMAVAPLAGSLVARIGGGRLMAMGLALVAIGLGWLAATTTARLDYLLWVPGLFLTGLGVGLAITAANAIVLTAVPATDRGTAYAMNNTGIELGGALGVSVLVTVFQQAGHAARATHDLTGPELFAAGIPPAVSLGAVVAGLGAIMAAILAARYDPTRIRCKLDTSKDALKV